MMRYSLTILSSVVPALLHLTALAMFLIPAGQAVEEEDIQLSAGGNCCCVVFGFPTISPLFLNVGQAHKQRKKVYIVSITFLAVSEQKVK